MAVLSFNIPTTSLKEGLKVFQVMPEAQKYITESYIQSAISLKPSKSVIHTSYITRPFSAMSFCKPSKIFINLLRYVELGKKMGINHILIHSPSTTSEWLSFGTAIANMSVIPDVTWLLEMPSLSKDLREYLYTDTPIKGLKHMYNEMFKALDKYPKKFQIVLDTAHMHANGLTGDEQVDLIKHLPTMSYIHLNGNPRAMYASDEHVPMYDKSNKIVYDTLCKFISSLDIVCFAENTRNEGTPEEWEVFKRKYRFD